MHTNLHLPLPFSAYLRHLINQNSTMPIRSIAFGRYDEFKHPDTIKAGVAEFISTFIFVFAGTGSGLALSKLTNDGPATPTGLVVAAIAHAFALFVAVSISANISGGHVNPAVTLGAFVGGNITFLRGLVYILGQVLGSIVACLLLEFVTNGMSVEEFTFDEGVGFWNAFVFEIVMTFGLVYTVYATAIDPKRGNLGTTAPIAIGFIVGANILAGGAFTGASMNPALSIGRVLVSWNITLPNHLVFWTAPLIGGAIAGFAYDFLFMNQTHDHLPTSA
ncbi:unnamed protein product [Lactuca saligna]|uniref:Tonoplast intrinsic protein n=1 Tax=Lactuca saligna TaxID=75948 RepID=A0AA35VH71_LACSI|nr:unnamed protein product [Lactuca saligna]